MQFLGQMLSSLIIFGILIVGLMLMIQNPVAVVAVVVILIAGTTVYFIGKKEDEKHNESIY